MKAKRLIIAAMLLFTVLQGLYAQAPQGDTLQQIPGLYLYNLPVTGDYHDDTIFCSVEFQWSELDPDTVCSQIVNLWDVEEYAIKMYTEDSLRIYGIAKTLDCSAYGGVLSLYDSAMNLLASTSINWYYGRISWLRSLLDSSNYHCFELAGLIHEPSEERYGITIERLLHFMYFNPKEHPYVSVKDTFYIGLKHKLTHYDDSYGIDSQPFLHELHQPPYAFPGSDYRIKVAGVWEDHHAARSIPMLFPITLPEDEQPGGGDPENPDPDNPNPDNPPEGISEVAVAVGFTLRPNPAREEVTLEGGAWMAGGVLTMTDMRGTEVVRRKVEGARLTLDVSRLPKGAYTVSVTTSEGTAARRLVVQ